MMDIHTPALPLFDDALVAPVAHVFGEHALVPESDGQLEKKKGGKHKRKTDGLIHRGYRCAFHPDKSQEETLIQAIGVVRLIYNLGLEQREEHWEAHRRHQVALRDKARRQGASEEEAHEIPLSISAYGQMKELTDLRKEFDWIRAHSVEPQQKALLDLHQAYQNFFTGRAERPTWRVRGINDVLRFDGKHLKIEQVSKKWATVYVPKVGKIRLRTSRPLPKGAKFLNATISKLPSGKWEIALAYELPRDHVSIWRKDPKAICPDGQSKGKPADFVAANRARQVAGNAIRKGSGIHGLPRESFGLLRNIPATGTTGAADLGVVTPVAVSDGTMFPSLKPRLSKIEAKIRRAQKKQAEQKKHRKANERISKRALRTKHRIASLKGKQARIRRHTCHEISTWIVETFERFAFEALNIANMTKSASGTIEKPGTNVAQKSGLNREILACAWGSIKTLVAYKIKDRPMRPGEEKILNDLLVFVDPKNTSRQCRKCGHTSKENRKTQARFFCEACHHEEHADVHAAKNIEMRAFGLSVLGLKAKVEPGNTGGLRATEIGKTRGPRTSKTSKRVQNPPEAT
jgi:putative transposase